MRDMNRVGRNEDWIQAETMKVLSGVGTASREPNYSIEKVVGSRAPAVMGLHHEIRFDERSSVKLQYSKITVFS